MLNIRYAYGIVRQEYDEAIYNSHAEQALLKAMLILFVAKSSQQSFRLANLEENAGGWILEGCVIHIWNDIAKKHFVSYVLRFRHFRDPYMCECRCEFRIAKGFKVYDSIVPIMQIVLVCVFFFKESRNIPTTQVLKMQGSPFQLFYFVGHSILWWQYHLPFRPKGPCKTVFEPIRIAEQK